MKQPENASPNTDSGHEEASTNEAWIARAESKLATQPPAVGVDVSDEMVERAFNAWCDVAVVDDYRVRNSREAIHAALTAALRTGGGA